MRRERHDDSGQAMHDLARELFPICRSITGDGVRQTLSILKKRLPALSVHEVPTGTRCYDWVIPNEWNIRDAYVLAPDGTKIIDFKKTNLSVVGYSVPVDATLSLDELQPHLHSLPEQPDAIPYVTSYYKERWGFCLPHAERKKLRPGSYRVHIDSDLKPGSLTYGELILPGRLKEEVFLSTYVCHPSLANNELSGPVVTTELARWLAALSNRRYTYRIVFVPETIGAIAYVSRHLEHLKKHVVAGYNVTCVGDDRSYSYLPSRAGHTLSDRVARHVLGHLAPGYKSYSFLDRGSDERQYCSPGVDLPVASVMRTKYAEYPEYHTSRDDLTVITPTGLAGGFLALRRCLEAIEGNEIYRTATLCEPQLGRRGLYPDDHRAARLMVDLAAYCDGTRDLIDVAEAIARPMFEVLEAVKKLKDGGLLAVADQ